MINVATAAIGWAIAKNQPIIEIIPITILIILVDFGICFKTNPSIIFEIPIIIKANPRKVIYNNVVAAGFEITHPDNAIAIAPKTI